MTLKVNDLLVGQLGQGHLSVHPDLTFYGKEEISSSLFIKYVCNKQGKVTIFTIGEDSQKKSQQFKSVTFQDI